MDAKLHMILVGAMLILLMFGMNHIHKPTALFFLVFFLGMTVLIMSFLFGYKVGMDKGVEMSYDSFRKIINNLWKKTEKGKPSPQPRGRKHELKWKKLRAKVCCDILEG